VRSAGHHRHLYCGGRNHHKTYVDVQRIARGTIDYVGLQTTPLMDSMQHLRVHNLIQSQSPDISMGVDTGGAGDQA